jgi:hypothetical protein
MAFSKGSRPVDMDAEMSRFEQEIARTATIAAPPVLNTFKGSSISMQFIPHQLKRQQPPPQPQQYHSSHVHQAPVAQRSTPVMPSMSVNHFAPHPAVIQQPPAPSTYSAPPTSTVSTAAVAAAPSLVRPGTFVQANYTLTPIGMPTQVHTVPPMPTAGPSSATANGAAATTSDAKKRPAKTSDKPKKVKKFIRAAGGQTWEDETLQEWEKDDFRIFCGDLGNDVNNEILSRAFGKYPSFLKSKVVRDKRTNKTKGYGFVSFKDPTDFIRAMREMNGKYVGSRPIKLRKSCWKDRGLEVTKKKIREKQKLGLL